MFLIAITMGATISIANFFVFVKWLIAVASGNSSLDLVENIGSLMFFIQHCIISGSFKWVGKIYKIFCKKKLGQQVQSSAPQGNN